MSTDPLETMSKTLDHLIEKAECKGDKCAQFISVKTKHTHTQWVLGIILTIIGSMFLFIMSYIYGIQDKHEERNEKILKELSTLNTDVIQKVYSLDNKINNLNSEIIRMQDKLTLFSDSIKNYRSYDGRR